MDRRKKEGIGKLGRGVPVQYSLQTEKGRTDLGTGDFGKTTFDLVP